MSDTVTYTLTEQEVFAALWHTRRSTTRLVVQTVILAVLGGVALVGLFRGMQDGATVLCGTVLPLLAILQWLWPFLEFRREARTVAEKHTALTIVFNNETLTVENETVAWQNAELRRQKDLVLWKVNRQWIVIPRRAVAEEWWSKSCEEAAA